VLLDIGSVFAGIGLAVVGFVIVIVVCVVILRLLAAILPSYEDRDARAAGDARVDYATGTAEVGPESAGEDNAAPNDEPAPANPDEGAAPV
jgi:hypothetical protein